MTLMYECTSRNKKKSNSRLTRACSLEEQIVYPNSYKLDTWNECSTVHYYNLCSPLWVWVYVGWLCMRGYGTKPQKQKTWLSRSSKLWSTASLITALSRFIRVTLMREAAFFCFFHFDRYFLSTTTTTTTTYLCTIPLEQKKKSLVIVVMLSAFDTVVVVVRRDG